MAPTLPIPQEIIDCIVDGLECHIPTLKNCALVSHSFLHPSRKYLFSTLHLLSTAHSRYLHERLSQTPEIALYIRELFVHGPYLTGDDDYTKCYDKAEDVAAGAWFTSDAAFFKIIQLADRLRLLSLNEHGPPIQWSLAFSKESQSALLNRFHSPHLAVLKIYRCHGLPISTLTSLTHLKGLSVSLENFERQSLPTHVPPLAQLKALELFKRPTPLPLCMFPPMPKLYLLSLHSFYDKHTYRVVEEVIRSCAESIKSVILNFREPSDVWLPPVPLKFITDLQSLFLSLTVSSISSVETPLEVYTGFLSYPEVTHSLKEFTLTLKSEPSSKFAHKVENWMNMAKQLPRLSHEWAYLDEVLSSISTLQRVHISIPCTGDLLADGILRIEMRGRLHRLHNRGILSLKTGENVGRVKSAVWSKATSV